MTEASTSQESGEKINDIEISPIKEVFQVPTEMSEYLGRLMKQGDRKTPIRTLKFFIEDNKSKENVAERIKLAQRQGNLSDDEAADLLEMLGVHDEDMESVLDARTKKPVSVVISPTLKTKTLKPTTEKVEGGFEVPEEVLAYLDRLIDQGRNLKLLQVVIQHLNSKEDVAQRIQAVAKTGVLASDELADLLEMLGVSDEELEKSLDELTNGKKSKTLKPMTTTPSPTKPLSAIEISPQNQKWEITPENKELLLNYIGSLLPGFGLTLDNINDFSLAISDCESLSDLERALRYYGGFLNSSEKEKILGLAGVAVIGQWIGNGEFSLVPSMGASPTPNIPPYPSYPGGTWTPLPPLQPLAPPPPPISVVGHEALVLNQDAPAPEQVIPPVLASAENIDDINANLEKARSEYARFVVEHKNKVREKKNILSKLFGDLGIETSKQKKMAELERSSEFLAAEKAYIEAKKKKAEGLFGKNEIIGEKVNFQDGAIMELPVNFNSELVDQAEKEWEALQQKITENIPPLEKGIILKGFEKWAQMPQWKRVAISTALMTGVGLTFGTVAVSGAAGYAGYRAFRSVVGAGTSQFVGGAVGKFQKQTIDIDRNKSILEYSKEIKPENFEAKEKELMNYFESEQNKKKRQRLYKAGAMMAAGVGVTVGIGALSHADTLHSTGAGSHDVPKSGGVRPDDSLRGNKPVVGQEIQPKSSFLSSVRGKFYPDNPPKVESHIAVPKEGYEHTSTPPTDPSEHTPDAPPSSASEFSPAKVELSSKGFTQTILDLKEKVRAEYGGDISKMPQEVKEFMDTPSSKLSVKFGFYDTEHHTSGMGMKGETLSLDEKGNLSLEHLDGKSDIINTDHQFAGKMVETHPVDHMNTAPHTEITESPKVEPVPVVESVPEVKPFEYTVERTPLEPIPSSTHGFDMPFSGKSFHIDVMDAGDHKAMLVDNVKVAEEVPISGVKNGVMLQLLDKYQDGKQYAPIREAFAKATGSFADAKNISLGNGQGLTELPFDHGKISIMNGLGEHKDGVNILLNGKEIAKGVLDNKGPHIKMLDTSGLKSGFFFADTVYERAFKEAMKQIKHLKLQK